MQDADKDSQHSRGSKDSSVPEIGQDDATQGQAGRQRATTSAFRGVCWHRKSRRWQSAINSSGRHVYLGSFDSEEEAARMFDKVAIRIRGTRAKINFPYQDYVGPDGRLKPEPKVDLLAAEARKAALEKQRCGQEQHSLAPAYLSTPLHQPCPLQPQHPELQQQQRCVLPQPSPPEHQHHYVQAQIQRDHHHIQQQLLQPAPDPRAPSLQRSLLLQQVNWTGVLQAQQQRQLLLLQRQHVQSLLGGPLQGGGGLATNADDHPDARYCRDARDARAVSHKRSRSDDDLEADPRSGLTSARVAEADPQQFSVFRRGSGVVNVRWRPGSGDGLHGLEVHPHDDEDAVGVTGRSIDGGLQLLPEVQRVGNSHGAHVPRPASPRSAAGGPGPRQQDPLVVMRPGTAGRPGGTGTGMALDKVVLRPTWEGTDGGRGTGARDDAGGALAGKGAGAVGHDGRTGELAGALAGSFQAGSLIGSSKGGSSGIKVAGPPGVGIEDVLVALLQHQHQQQQQQRLMQEEQLQPQQLQQIQQRQIEQQKEVERQKPTGTTSALPASVQDFLLLGGTTGHVDSLQQLRQLLQRATEASQDYPNSQFMRDVRSVAGVGGGGVRQRSGGCLNLARMGDHVDDRSPAITATAPLQQIATARPRGSTTTSGAGGEGGVTAAAETTAAASAHALELGLRVSPGCGGESESRGRVVGLEGPRSRPYLASTQDAADTLAFQRLSKLSVGIAAHAPTAAAAAAGTGSAAVPGAFAAGAPYGGTQTCVAAVQEPGTGPSGGLATLVSRFLQGVWQHIPACMTVGAVVPSSDPELLGYIYVPDPQSEAASVAQGVDLANKAIQPSTAAAGAGAPAAAVVGGEAPPPPPPILRFRREGKQSLTGEAPSDLGSAAAAVVATSDGHEEVCRKERKTTGMAAGELAEAVEGGSLLRATGHERSQGGDDDLGASGAEAGAVRPAPARRLSNHSAEGAASSGADAGNTAGGASRIAEQPALPPPPPPPPPPPLQPQPPLRVSPPALLRGSGEQGMLGTAVGAPQSAGAGVFWRGAYRNLGLYSSKADATQACRACMALILDLLDLTSTGRPVAQAPAAVMVAGCAASAPVAAAPDFNTAIPVAQQQHAAGSKTPATAPSELAAAAPLAAALGVQVAIGKKVITAIPSAAEAEDERRGVASLGAFRDGQLLLQTAASGREQLGSHPQLGSTWPPQQGSVSVLVPLQQHGLRNYQQDTELSPPALALGQQGDYGQRWNAADQQFDRPGVKLDRPAIEFQVPGVDLLLRMRELVTGPEASGPQRPSAGADDSQEPEEGGKARLLVQLLALLSGQQQQQQLAQQQQQQPSLEL